jgi:hypothetical protein
MASNPQALKICSMCRLVRDDRDVVKETWITKKKYRQITGIAPGVCKPIYTFCSACIAFIDSHRTAA